MTELFNLSLWLVGLSLTSSVMALGLARYLLRYRGRPGVHWFIATLVAVAIFCGAYGIGLLVFDSAIRLGLEVISVTALCFIGPLFLGFGLDYMGRSDIAHSPWYAITLVAPASLLPVAATNAYHGWLWSDAMVVSQFGAAAVTFTWGPWTTGLYYLTLAMTGIGILLLVLAIINYGPLYRREAVAVILSIVPPLVGLFLWYFDLGIAAPLNLTPMLFIPHLLLDGYAFVGTQMFETNPTTQRAARRQAFFDRTEPQFVIDPNGQIVDVNERASSVFGVDPADVPLPFEAVVGMSVSELLDLGEIEPSNATGRTFAVSVTRLEDPDHDYVGDLVVCYDVTGTRLREERLSVLNRVLRHNLRNEMTVITGYADMLAADADTEQHRGYGATITKAGQRLLRVGEKVREFDEIQSSEQVAEPVAIETMLTDIVEQVIGTHSPADVTVECTDDCDTIVTDPARFELGVRMLVENAVIHATDTPNVMIRAKIEDASLVIEIVDQNPQIPAIERNSLEERAETALQHGQGVGLWIAKWSATELGGTLSFAYEDGNVVRMQLPRR